MVQHLQGSPQGAVLLLRHQHRLSPAMKHLNLYSLMQTALMNK
jgi:hypothetical protein